MITRCADPKTVPSPPPGSEGYFSYPGEGDSRHIFGNFTIFFKKFEFFRGSPLFMSTCINEKGIVKIQK